MTPVASYRSPTWSEHDTFELVRLAAGPDDVGSVELLRSGRVLRTARGGRRRPAQQLLAACRPAAVGLPRRVRPDPTAQGTEVRWHASFDAPSGFGWVYVAALRGFTGRMLDRPSQRLRDRTTTVPFVFQVQAATDVTAAKLHEFSTGKQQEVWS